MTKSLTPNAAKGPASAELQRHVVFDDPKHHIRLYQGDCLDLLALIPESSVDLIFADPPTSSPTAASPATPDAWSASTKARGTNPKAPTPITNSIARGSPPAKRPQTAINSRCSIDQRQRRATNLAQRVSAGDPSPKERSASGAAHLHPNPRHHKNKVATEPQYPVATFT